MRIQVIICFLISFVLCQFCTETNKYDYFPKNESTCDSVALSDLILDKNLGLFFYNNEKFTGIGINYYEHELVAEEISFLNGQKNGKLERFFPDGSKSYHAFYKNGKLEGEVRSWWSKGAIRTINLYEDGVASGKQLQYYRSGQLFKEINLVSGREEGMQKSWRENGKLYNNYEARNGRIFGLKRSSLCFKLKEEIVQYKS